MRFALFSFTERGALMAEKISQGLRENGAETEVYIHRKVAESIIELVSRLFSKYDALIFVAACGIAVRAIAPNIKSKATDPAVVVCDEFGRHVIPILAGHIGGANDVAVDIALITGGEAVLTTATDINGVFSVDVWAKKNNLIIKNLSVVKLISTRLLREETVGFYSEYPYKGTLPENILEGDYRCGIYIGMGYEKSPFPVTLALVPKNLVLGIGCRRGTAREVIEEAVNLAGVPVERVLKICSIDIKSNETGLLEYAEAHGIKTEFFSAESLMHLEGDFSASDYVRDVTGADNVCERAATLGGGEGKLIKRKTAHQGVTVALFENNIDLRFE